MNPLTATRRLLSRVSWLLLLAGGVVIETGLWLFEYFSPSPHMLLEIAFAMPLMGLGGVLAAVDYLPRADAYQSRWP